MVDQFDDLFVIYWYLQKLRPVKEILYICWNTLQIKNFFMLYFFPDCTTCLAHLNSTGWVTDLGQSEQQ